MTLACAKLKKERKSSQDSGCPLWTSILIPSRQGLSLNLGLVEFFVVAEFFVVVIVAVVVVLDRLFWTGV